MSERLGKYELLSRIATGGMAEIYLARTATAGIDRLLVIKTLLPHYVGRPEFVDMFLDEARIGAILNHPNIVQMYDFGTLDTGSCASFMAMEYVHGEDVRTIARHLLSQKTIMPVEHAVNIVASACAGLHHAHEARGIDGSAMGIVHRDVSPHNIIVTFEGATKLVDFGIARAKNRMTQTKHGSLKGKVPYMAPEQLTSSRLDRRVDTYAAGVVLYELLTGKRPYLVAKRAEFDLMMSIVKGQVRPIDEAHPGLPKALCDIVMKAMSRAPSGRYQTALELQTALEDFAREEKLRLTASALAGYMKELFGERVDRWGKARGSSHLMAEYAVAVERERASTISSEEDYVLEELTISNEADVATEGDGSTTDKSAVLPHQLATSATAISDNAADVGARLHAIPSPGVEIHHSVLGEPPRDVSIVKIAGRLSESFRGGEIGRCLRGSVVLELSGVERITSFGIREWLSMMSEARSNAATLYLARLSDVVVNQLNMIRAFSGGATVVSFLAPYLCDACGHNFMHLVDCEREAAMIRASAESSAALPTRQCVKCGSQAGLDDDPSYFSFATAHLDVPIPNIIRSAIDSLGDTRAAVDSVEKLVMGENTKIRVRGEVDRSFRWNRALDGLEGAVTIDFEGVRFHPNALAGFIRAIRGIDSAVSAIDLTATPKAVVLALDPSGVEGRIRVSSVSLTGYCTICKAPRTAIVPFNQYASLGSGRPSSAVTCRRCSSQLMLEDDNLRSMAADAPASNPRLPAAGSVERAPPSSGDSRSLSVIETPVPSSRGGETFVGPDRRMARMGRPDKAVKPSRPIWARHRVLIGLAIGLSVALPVATAIIVMNSSTTRNAGAASAHASAASSPGGLSASSLLASPTAAWMKDPAIRRETASGRIFIIGRSGHLPANTKESEALALAHTDALRSLMQVVVEDMKSSPTKAYLSQVVSTQGPPNSSASERFNRVLGSGNVAFDRMEMVTQKSSDGGRIEVIALYRISAASVEQIAEPYTKTTSLAGLTIAPVFPLLDGASQGEIMIVAADERARRAGVEVGDVIVRVDDRLGSFDYVQSLRQPPKFITVERRGGQTRKISLGK